MRADILVEIIAILIILEGVFVSFFSKQTSKILKEILKNPKKLKKYGIIELIIGIILLIVVIFL